MYVSCTIADLMESKESTEFDAWLHLASIGNKIILDLPIKKHKHFYKWNNKGKRLNSYIITDRYIQFSFEIETGPKKEGNKLLGIDTGINALASLSNSRKALKQRIDEVVQAIIVNPRLMSLTNISA